MAETVQTPIWLQIDDNNFKDLLEYLGKNARNGASDPFYSAAVQLLRQRVANLIPTMASDLAGDEETLLFRIRLLGAWILCFPEKTEEQNFVMFCFLNCLSQIVPEAAARNLFNLSLDAILCGNIRAVGFGWDDLIDMRKEMLAHKLINGFKYSADGNRDLWFDGKGLLHLTGNGISVSAMNRSAYIKSKARLDDCLAVAEGKISAGVDKNDKLKQSESSDIAAIKKFSREFRRSQHTVTPTAETLRKYSVDQEVVVRVTNNRGVFTFETADPNYEKIAGTFYHPKGLFYYTDIDFAKALDIGDCFKAVIVDKENGQFSIYDMLQNELINLVEEGKSYPAEYLSEHKEGSLWRTNEGVPVYVKNPGAYGKGDRAYLYVELVGSNGYIRAAIDEDQSDIEKAEFDDPTVWFIREYIRFDYTAPKVSKGETVDSDFVKILSRSLYNYQKTLSSPSEIYKTLCMCQMLSELTEDDRELHYLELKADYLE